VKRGGGKERFEGPGKVRSLIRDDLEGNRGAGKEEKKGENEKRVLRRDGVWSRIFRQPGTKGANLSQKVEGVWTRGKAGSGNFRFENRGAGTGEGGRGRKRKSTKGEGERER